MQTLYVEDLPHLGHSSYYRFFLQKDNCTLNFYCETEKMSAGELVAALLDKGNAMLVPSGSCLAGSSVAITRLSLSSANGDAQHGTGLKATPYVQHSTDLHVHRFAVTCITDSSMSKGLPISITADT